MLNENDYKRKIDKLVKANMDFSNGVEIKKYPVCGNKSLIVYEDIEYNGCIENGEAEDAYRYTNEVKCVNCTFELNNHIQNPSKIGLEIEDYWFSNKL